MAIGDWRHVIGRVSRHYCASRESAPRLRVVPKALLQ
jgi:hypothetical protein